MSLSGTEFRAAVVLLMLLFAGLVARYVRHGLESVPPHAYGEAARVLREGALAPDSGLAGLPSNSVRTAVQPETTGSAERNLLYHFEEGRLDVNRATAAELELLPYIGPALAHRIVAYRAQHGLFKDVRELDHVKGIGEKTLERIAPYIYAGE